MDNYATLDAYSRTENELTRQLYLARRRQNRVVGSMQARKQFKDSNYENDVQEDDVRRNNELDDSDQDQHEIIDDDNDQNEDNLPTKKKKLS